MRILILASQNMLYLPLNNWLGEDITNNEYILFIKKEHERSYKELIENDKFIVKTFENWNTNNNIEISAIELHRQRIFDKIISVSESDIERTARLREFLKVDGQWVYSASIFRDKYIMKKYVSRLGIPTPKFQKVDNYIDGIKFLNKYGYPAVLKPIDGSGSVNTHVLKSITDFNKISCQLNLKNMIIETFIDGNIYHIDGIILDSELKFITVARYVNDPLSYIDKKSTASVFLKNNCKNYDLILNFSKKLINILPCPSNMTFHLEVFYDGSDITFCEIACRTGGGRIVECIQEEFGFNITRELIRHEVGIKSLLLGVNNEYVWRKNRGFILSSPLKGILEYVPETIPFDWVFDYWKFARIGTEFDGSKSSVHSIAAFSCEGETEEDLIEKLTKIDEWFKDHCIYQLNI